MLQFDEEFIFVGKQFSRKESTDSGISAGSSSRKTSTTSSLGRAEGILEEPSEETIKEETPFTEPDDDLCEKITQQVINQHLCRFRIRRITMLQKIETPEDPGQKLHYLVIVIISSNLITVPISTNETVIIYHRNMKHRWKVEFYKDCILHIRNYFLC